jgi:maltooligosyltrehalose trehalohydrolase
MHTFRVWAPRAQRVDVVLDGQAFAMEPTERGWWQRTIDGAGVGTLYFFSLDGGAPRPDPRSNYQPQGIDGPSQVVDHEAFRWSDESWRGFDLPGAILYELHVGTFSSAGTFDGVIEHLPHLVQLGVDAIELMPVCEFSGSRGWGYDGVDLYAPHHAYGGPDGLKRLVDACHRANLGVVIDVVYNHLGPAGNYLPEFGPYFTDRHRTNWGEALNYQEAWSDEVRNFVIDNAIMWLRDYHCDGLRIDAVHAIVDTSAVHVLEQLAVEVHQLSEHLRRPPILIPETDLNDPRFVRSRHAGGFGLNSAWADEWHHALHAALTGETSGYYADFGSIAALAKALKQAWVYDGVWSPFRLRTHGRPPTGLEGHCFVVSTQNHDQVGNRALGERSSALMSSGRLKVAAALLLTSPFVPLLFAGEEWAAATPFQYFTDHADPALGRAVSVGRRTEFAYFGWDPHRVPDPQDRATFERSKLDWSERGKEVHSEVLAWYRELITLRKSWPALTDGCGDRVNVRFDEGARWLVLERLPLVVAANVGTAELRLPLEVHHFVTASDAGVRLQPEGVILPPDTVAILRK